MHNLVKFVHYTTFTCGKGIFKLIFFFNRFLIFKKFQISQILNCELFLSVDNQLTSSQKNSHQNSFIKKLFSLVIYKIDCF
jgi:hypothetical protein